MYYVYILKNRINNRIYIGLTINPNRRLKEHNQGETENTKDINCWYIVCVIGFKYRNKAWQFEQYLKRGSGFAFMKKRLLP